MVHISDDAATKLRELLQAQARPGQAVRVTVSGYG